MSRRRGQSGNVFQKSQPWQATAVSYGRFWIDVPGSSRQRKTITLGVCRTPTIAKQRLREHLEREHINDAATFASRTNATTFGEQAAIWIAGLPTRTRKPVKQSTIANWRYSLDKWLLPLFEHTPLCDVGNAALKKLIAQLTQAGLKPKSIVNILDPLKMVVASCVNEDGEQIHKRNWDTEEAKTFVGQPTVDANEQDRPTLTPQDVETILNNTIGRSFVLFVLLLGSGLRIGEALELRTSDLSEDGRTIHITRNIWRGVVGTPKTKNGVRSVDVAKPLADLLLEYVKGREGYIFTTRTGKSLVQRNALSYLHKTGVKKGLHSLRRFRCETLERAEVPTDLLKFWMGHARSSVTELYSRGLSKDVERRQTWAEKAGLGFELNFSNGLLGLQRKAKTAIAVAA